MAQRRDGARHIPRAASTGELGFLRRVVSKIFSNLPQRGLHCTGHTVAIPDTTLAAYFNLKHRLAGIFVFHHCDMPELKPPCLVGSQAGIDGE